MIVRGSEIFRPLFFPVLPRAPRGKKEKSRVASRESNVNNEIATSFHSSQ